VIIFYPSCRVRAQLIMFISAMRARKQKNDDNCINSSCVATVFVELTLLYPSFVHGNNVVEVRVGHHARPDELFGVVVSLLSWHRHH
jgi:hypothetical protein